MHGVFVHVQLHAHAHPLEHFLEFFGQIIVIDFVEKRLDVALEKSRAARVKQRRLHKKVEPQKVGARLDLNRANPL